MQSVILKLSAFYTDSWPCRPQLVPHPAPLNPSQVLLSAPPKASCLSHVGHPHPREQVALMVCPPACRSLSSSYPFWCDSEAELHFSPLFNLVKLVSEPTEIFIFFSFQNQPQRWFLSPKKKHYIFSSSPFQIAPSFMVHRSAFTHPTSPSWSECEYVSELPYIRMLPLAFCTYNKMSCTYNKMLLCLNAPLTELFPPSKTSTYFGKK